jgi:hypothetical protein
MTAPSCYHCHFKMELTSYRPARCYRTYARRTIMDQRKDRWFNKRDNCGPEVKWFLRYTGPQRIPDDLVALGKLLAYRGRDL